MIASFVVLKPAHVRAPAAGGNAARTMSTPTPVPSRARRDTANFVMNLSFQVRRCWNAVPPVTSAVVVMLLRFAGAGRVRAQSPIGPFGHPHEVGRDRLRIAGVGADGTTRHVRAPWGAVGGRH